MVYPINIRDNLTSMLDRLGLMADDQVSTVMSELGDDELYAIEYEVVDGVGQLIVRASDRLQSAIDGAALRRAFVSATVC